MKRFKSEEDALHRPFEDLRFLLKDHPLKKSPSPKEEGGSIAAESEAEEDEQALFEKAMSGVVPLGNRRRLPVSGSPKKPAGGPQPEKDDTLHRLNCLIRNGKGFVVAQTAEYMEGPGTAAPPDIFEQLHQGRYAIQAHIDLHGQTAAEAKETFDRFLTESTRLNRRAVLVVHGRGLSSPNRPVLKKRVQEWLSSGYWRKWVLAFCSARLCDGGAGATYVLLTGRPLTKKQRKNRRTSNAERRTSNVE